MQDNLLEMMPTETTAAAKQPVKAKRPRPAEVPEKFWDEAAGELRVDALVKSYRELEKKLSRMVAVPADDSDEEERAAFLRALGVPATPDEYAIEPKHDLAPDAEVNQRLHKAGFTPAQVQLVYDLAGERLMPLILEAAQQYEAEKQTQKLVEHFGGAERWKRTAKQLGAWGRANLPQPVFEALSSTFEGILALQKMMEKGEPSLMRGGEPDGPLGEAELRKMMDDPRYWKKRDSAFIERVQDGFKRLYPSDK